MIAYIKANLPNAKGFMALRQDTDWGAISMSQAQAALSASLCGISLYAGADMSADYDAQIDDDQNTLIAMARVIGDGVLNLYIQDVIVAQTYRGQGYGTKLIEALITSLQQKFPKDCTVGLLAATGQAPFYTRFGFLARPSAVTDAGMNAQLGALHGQNQA